MHRHTRRHATGLLLGWLLVILVAGCGGGGSDEETETAVDESIVPTGPFAEIQKKVPKSTDLTGWKRSGAMTILVRPGYTAPAGAKDVPAFKSLAQSDLAAETALLTEYKYESGVVQMFEKEEGAGSIRLEIHQVSVDREAYGLVTVAGIGQSDKGRSAKRKAPGKLTLAKDRYFVRIIDTSEGAQSPGANDTVIADIARAVEMKIFAGMRVAQPDEMRRLPQLHCVKDSEVYVHGPKGLALAEKKLGEPLTRVLGPVLGDATLVAAKYTAPGGGDNVVFILNRSMATGVPQPVTKLDPHVGNDFAYTVCDRYVIIGTFNPEEESLQRIVSGIEAGYPQ